MIKQSFVNSDSILEKKFKILRMSIMLGNARNREETLNEYEETAREISKYQKSLYEEILSSKMYTTTTLEEEAERLTDLIKFIEDRVKKRNEFIDDYLKITNNFLDGIDKVSEEDNLLEYKSRLDNITRYLDNTHEMEEINKTLEDKRKELEEKYENKANSEIINSKLEEELIDEFNKIITNDEYYKNLNYLDIDNELNEINNAIDEKKEVMNTFISSYEALKNAGISGAEREEYLSYVQDAKEDYYKSLERRYILEIYKLVLDKISDYDKLYEKREKIETILNERVNDRQELDISERDNLEYFYNICNEQFSIIKSQKYNMENIDKLIEEITNCEKRLEELENDNNREEIVSLLEEYSVDKPIIEKVELPEEKKIHDEIIEKNLDENPKPANMVVKITEPIKMNVRTASDTAKLVMKKVVIVLEPKKFNGKKDKLKEAELELEERKKKEKILEEEKKILNDEKEIDNKELEIIDPVGIKLDTHDVFTDDDEDEINGKVKEVDEIKINIPSDREVSIPTEIFIEEPKEEKAVDLFKETDPFLDDNEFEINDKTSDSSRFASPLPKISNIGTVKPNNMLSKVEDAVKENDNIILPTMGLTDTGKVDVPIVSENYIQ
ncbi:MAG: hypothetical protein ACI4WU_01080 [Bacilli bacterium]